MTVELEGTSLLFPLSCHVLSLKSTEIHNVCITECLTQYGSTVYIGMALVGYRDQILHMSACIHTNIVECLDCDLLEG